jgi:hypothetical protein
VCLAAAPATAVAADAVVESGAAGIGSRSVVVDDWRKVGAAGRDERAGATGRVDAVGDVEDEEGVKGACRKGYRSGEEEAR